jgi:regulator of sirC expression with transglutaminase-like and TPR domain
MLDKLLEARESFEKNDLTHSLDLLNEIVHLDPGNSDALMLRGLIFHRMQKWGEAINDFATVLELVPDHNEAKSRLEMAKNILGYFTPDMFNP